MPDHIELEGVSLSYHWQSFHKKIITDLSFKVSQGSFVSILGSNGSGKSSLLKLIIGLEKPDAGSIKVSGSPIRYGQPEMIRSGHVAYLSQQVQEMFFSDTVGEELAYNKQSKSVTKQLVKIDPTRRISDLSGGERQSLALDIFMNSPAALLILDEPTSYLDYSHAQELQQYLEQSHRNGRTVLHVTQYPGEAIWGTHVLDLDDAQPQVKPI